jgi:sec-independent protein translocase protein TatA
MGSLKPWHIIVIVLLLVVLFGAKRLPDAARSLGRSLRIFKAETKNLMEDDVRAKSEAQSGRVITPEIPDDQASPLPPRTEPVEPRRDER